MHHSHDFNDYMDFMFFQEFVKEEAIEKAVAECVHQVNMGRRNISIPRGDFTDKDIEEIKKRLKARTGCVIYD